MDYQRIYSEFIADRKAKPKPEGYTERHHILPRSLGGGDVAANLIDLTAEDHFFAHLLLAKIHGGGMWFAVQRMRWGRVGGERPWISGRYMYAAARKRAAMSMSEMFAGQEGRRGADNGRYDAEGLTWHNLDTGEIATATKWEMWERHGGCRAHWTSAAIGSRKSMKGWTARPGNVRIRGGKGKTFQFVNRDGRTFVGRQIEFIKFAGISAASASRVTRHGDVTMCGWRLLGQSDRSAGMARDGKFAWQHRKNVRSE